MPSVEIELDVGVSVNLYSDRNGSADICVFVEVDGFMVPSVRIPIASLGFIDEDSADEVAPVAKALRDLANKIAMHNRDDEALGKWL